LPTALVAVGLLDYFISTQFQIERIKWAQQECFQSGEGFRALVGRLAATNKGLNRLRSIRFRAKARTSDLIRRELARRQIAAI